MSCQSCNATTTNGLTLCELCQTWLRKCCEYLPTYYTNLSRWRPGRAGSRPVPSSREPRTISNSYDDRVARALDAAHQAITEWTDRLALLHPEQAALHPTEAIYADLTDLTDAHQFALRIAGLERWLTSIATTSHAGLLAHDVQQYERILRSLTEAVAPGWYAGSCKRETAPDTRCGAPIHVVPGLTWVTCHACGSTTYARDHLDTLLDEARDWTAPPKPLAAAIVALLDTEGSIEDLRKRIAIWGNRGHIQPIQRTRRQHTYDRTTDTIELRDVPHGPKRYRLGDVLDQLLAPTRRNTKTA